jgi:hypothetical protein
MRGWGRLDQFVERWSGGEEHCCRLLVGMQRLSARAWTCRSLLKSPPASAMSPNAAVGISQHRPTMRYRPRPGANTLGQDGGDEDGEE